MKIQIRKEGERYCAYYLKGTWSDGEERWDYIEGSLARTHEECKERAGRGPKTVKVVEEFEI